MSYNPACPCPWNPGWTIKCRECEDGAGSGPSPDVSLSSGRRGGRLGAPGGGGSVVEFPPGGVGQTCTIEQSSEPVRYATGGIVLSVDHLASSGFGLTWGHRREYASGFLRLSETGNGPGWKVADWPVRTFDMQHDRNPCPKMVVLGSREAYWFHGTTYAPLFGNAFAR